MYVIDSEDFHQRVEAAHQSSIQCVPPTLEPFANTRNSVISGNAGVGESKATIGVGGSTSPHLSRHYLVADQEVLWKRHSVAVTA